MLFEMAKYYLIIDIDDDEKLHLFFRSAQCTRVVRALRGSI